MLTADDPRVLSRTDVLIVGQVRAAGPPTGSFTGEDLPYSIQVEEVLGGPQQPDRLAVVYSHHRAHQRGKLLVHPLRFGSGIEAALRIGARYLFMLELPRGRPIVLVRAEPPTTRAEIQRAWRAAHDAASPGSTQAGIALRNCVFHAGGSKSEKSGATLTQSCWFDAECFARPGTSQPGDGFVSIRCQQEDCTCKIEEAAPGGRHAEFHLRAAAPCASPAATKILLRDRCHRGPIQGTVRQ